MRWRHVVVAMRAHVRIGRRARIAPLAVACGLVLVGVPAARHAAADGGATTRASLRAGVAAASEAGSGSAADRAAAATVAISAEPAGPSTRTSWIVIGLVLSGVTLAALLVRRLSGGGRGSRRSRPFAG